MQIAYALCTGFLMQAVYILGDHEAGMIAHFQLCDMEVGGVRLRIADHRPANQATPPITLASFIAFHELTVLNWLLALPGSVAIAVIGNAGICAYASPSQNHQPGVVMNKLCQQLTCLFRLM